jgi:hypothetical protein
VSIHPTPPPQTTLSLHIMVNYFIRNFYLFIIFMYFSPTQHNERFT